MKTLRSVTLSLLIAASAITATTTTAATTGELLQQALYAEEVEGNIDSAIKTYGQVITNSSASANHMAQALYRQGLCFLKIQDEASARVALGRLVSDYSGQTEIVEKARPLLEDLMDFDPAALMPAGTLAYLEFGSPGKQIETVLGMLKGTPYENPLAAVAGNQPPPGNGQKSPADIVGAMLNPSMIAEFKKIRSSAVGITGIADNEPQMVSVLYPGKSDALRGLILAALGMAGQPGPAVEGLPTVNLPDDMAVAYDERVVILARPASQLAWTVKQYKGKQDGPTLASSNKSFAKVSKAQRQKNVLTAWVNVDESYDRITKLFPDGQFPAQLAAANAIVDFKHIEDLIWTESLLTNGSSTRIELLFKDGHRCLAYDLIRTPNLSMTALEAVPAEAIAVASFAMNPALASRTDTVRAQVQNLTGLDIGREIFSNLEQVMFFALPVAAGSVSNAPLDGQFGVVLTSRNPGQTQQLLATLLETANPGQSNPVAGRYQISRSGQPDRYCYVEQVNGATVLSLDRRVVEASANASRNRKSIRTGGPMNPTVNKLPLTASKLFMANAGGVMRLAGPFLQPPGLKDGQAKAFADHLDQLARAMDATTLELRTDEQINHFVVNANTTGLPPFSQILGPAMQLSGLIEQGNAEAIADKLRREKPAIIMPAAKAPVIDGNADDAWSRVTRVPLARVISSFGSGERPAAVSTAADLAADFRALADAQNLYLLVDVKDDKLVADTNPDQPVTVPSGSSVIPWWYDDSVEIYLDADNAKAGEYDANDYLLRFNWHPTRPGFRAYNRNVETPLAGVEFAMVATDAGYRTEVKVPWSALGVSPKTGATIGLDVHVNDDDDGGARDSKISWHDSSDTAWQRPQAFGNGALAGMIGWWKFDETQGAVATDSSGGNHNGTLAGHAKWGKGRLGGAIDLDGAGSFVRIADESSFDIAGELTVACWVNVRSVPNEWTAIVTKGDKAWRLSTAGQERKFHFSVSDWSSIQVDGEILVGQGGWHHLGAVYDGATVSLYVDGKLDATKPFTGGTGNNDFAVLIGENDEQKGRCFDGLIDDVRVYNHALSPDQIKALASGP